MATHALTAISTLMFIGGIASTLYAEADASKRGDGSPSGFATVSQAKTTTIVKGVKQSKSQAAYLGLIAVDRDGELVVQEVAPDSAADRAEFLQDDVLLKAADMDLENESKFAAVLAGFRAEQEVDFVVRRDEKELTLSVTFAAVSNPLIRTSRSNSRTRTMRRGVLGVQMEPSDSPAGIRVQSVFDGSGADLAGVQVGDVITQFQGKQISNSQGLVVALMRTKPGDTVTLSVLRNEDKLKMEVELGNTLGGRTSSQSSGQRWSKGSYRLAVIGIEYPDQLHNDKIETADWEESLFSSGEYTGRNATGQRVYGSMNDYYRELSSAKFGVEGKFFDWVKVKKNRDDYMRGSRSAVMTEAMDLVLDRDGKDALKDFDGVFFLYAGSRVRTERGALYWPHRGSLSHKRKRWSYFIMQEGGSRMSNISVMCHEFGHMLGLPDLYSKDSRAEGLGVWCAMSNQSGNGRPQHFSAWCKEQLGWLKPTVIDPREKQKLILGQVERSDKECYKVLLKPDGSEYLLLENRRQFGFDASLPSQGLLIWRVSGNRPVLQESHGVAGPAGPGSFRDFVPYPSKANDAYTPRTTPSSQPVNDDSWPVHITNIRELEDGRISFYIGYKFL